MAEKMTFALCFCNRGFMPGELIYGARDDMVKAVTDAGYDYIMMDKNLTRYGGVETRDEGLLYARWLKERQGQYDGVIFSMPIFADENGAITALQNAGVPILMQAYPDEIGKMDFAHRRDAYCGKFSVTDVFTQYNVPFTVLKPHVVHPLSPEFQENLRDFAAICRVVNGMKRFNLGCIGARTTAFKTVRFDEIAMQKHGINVESFDLSELFAKVREKRDDDPAVLAKVERLQNYTDCSQVPAGNMATLAKVAVVLDEYIEEYHLDALALRCWNKMETYLRICPCVLPSELNDRGIVASCEIDMCSAITMRAMSLATEGAATVLDWNNNYGDNENKVILFHCGPVAQSLMTGKGIVTEHKMFAKNDPGSGWGCNEGRIKPMPITISNCQTKDGKIVVYASEAKFTDDPIEDAFFGCGGVAEIPDLQNKLIKLARGGSKHHTSVCEGHVKDVLKESFTTYLGYDSRKSIFAKGIKTSYNRRMGKQKIVEYFEEVEANREYSGYFCSIPEAISIVVLGSMCGLRNISQIHQWAESDKVSEFLKEEFGIEHIPCYYWLLSLLKLIKPESLNKCLMKWAESILPKERKGLTISLDGKTVRSTCKMKSYDSPLHIISAQISELGITFASKSVEGKSNEIPAVQQLIGELSIQECMVVADALNCQRETAETIVRGKGDYLLDAKGNQPVLEREIREYVQDESLRKTMDRKSVTEKSRDRIETRTAYTTTDVGWLWGKEKWKNLCCIGAIKTEFERKGTKTEEWHYYISSRDLTALELLHHARMEWAVESMHWILDVHFSEDFCRIVNRTIQQNLNMLRKFALSLMKQFKTASNSKRPLSQIMFNCLLDPSVISHILEN